MIILLYGPDSFSREKYLTTLKNKFQKDIDSSGLNIMNLDGEKIKFPELKNTLTVTPLFSTKRLIIVKNLIGKNKDKELLLKLEKLLAAADRILTSTIVIFNEENITNSAGNPLIKIFKQNKTTYEFPALNFAQTKAWVAGQINPQNPNVVNALAEQIVLLVGSNLYELDNEIKKLQNFTTGRTPRVEDLSQIITTNFNTNIFQFVDAIGNRNSSLAAKLMEQELGADSNEIYLLTMIIRQFRILLQVKDLVETQNIHRSEDLAKQLNLHPFVAQKSMQQATIFSLPELKKNYTLLLQADIDIKTGKLAPKVALEVLLTKVLA